MQLLLDLFFRRLLLKEKCAAASVHFVQTIFFYIEDCMTASGNISMFSKERAAASHKDIKKKRLLLKCIKEEKKSALAS